MAQATARHSIRTLAQELACIAHARALHAVHPILSLGTPRHRDVVYRALAEEFEDLAATVEDLLRRSELTTTLRTRRPPEERAAADEEARRGRDAALTT